MWGSRRRSSRSSSPRAWRWSARRADAGRSAESSSGTSSRQTSSAPLPRQPRQRARRRSAGLPLDRRDPGSRRPGRALRAGERRDRRRGGGAAARPRARRHLRRLRRDRERGGGTTGAPARARPRARCAAHRAQLPRHRGSRLRPRRDVRVAFVPAGLIGFSSQSGALGLALLEAAETRGLGLSAFVSIGNKADVSRNDLLEWWEDDEATEAILLYVERSETPASSAHRAESRGASRSWRSRAARLQAASAQRAPTPLRWRGRRRRSMRCSSRRA